MNLSAQELRKLALPLAIGVALLAAGGALLWWSQQSVDAARRGLAAAQNDRTQATQRLARIAEEEREVKEKIEVYRQLKALNIIGEERRLEWADSIARIRAAQELLDVRYRVDRQKLLASVAARPNNVDFFASTMSVSLALLHEGDLLRFLADLRASGNAYYSVRRCRLMRTGLAPTGTSIQPRLNADCQIDLITILDRAAKS